MTPTPTARWSDRNVIQPGRTLIAAAPRRHAESTVAPLPAEASHRASLTEREGENLELVARGVIARHIGTLLPIGVPNLREHLEHVHDRLDAPVPRPVSTRDTSRRRLRLSVPLPGMDADVSAGGSECLWKVRPARGRWLGAQPPPHDPGAVRRREHEISSVRLVAGWIPTLTGELT